MRNRSCGRSYARQPGVAFELWRRPCRGARSSGTGVVHARGRGRSGGAFGARANPVGRAPQRERERPRLAARLGLGLTGDAIGIEFDTEGRMVALKPAFGGNIVAPILSRTFPQMA